MVFQSSKNIFVALFIIGMSIGLLIHGISGYRTGQWYFLIIDLIVTLFLVTSFFIYRYRIHNDSLRIETGFFKSKFYPINEWSSIQKIRSFIAASGAGTKRLEIITKKGNILTISPKERDKFIQVIKAINPNIKIMDEDL